LTARNKQLFGKSRVGMDVTRSIEAFFSGFTSPAPASRRRVP
jgi:hypothetical protein